MVDESENNAPFQIRPLSPQDRNWVAHFLDEHWSSTKIVTRGQAYYAHLLPGFVAEMTDAPEDAPPAGLITYRMDAETKSCEIMTLNSLQVNQGIGTALLESVKEVARAEGCKRMWLVTTNDNLDALRFLQKRNMRLVAVYAGALAEARKLKPQIPLVGKDSIPLHDEIELQIAF